MAAESHCRVKTSIATVHAETTRSSNISLLADERKSADTLPQWRTVGGYCGVMSKP